MNKDFSAIPANACILSVGEFAIGDNGESAKTAPLSMVARSGKPIEHWFWGRVVHDLSGMRLAKPRLPVDYCHDDKEVIGYLNKFDAATGDLVASGALVPFKDNDRATEIVHKMKAGVPYEASINFGGDGIKVEDVPEGFVAQVNGYEFAGPGIIVREWPLRGVAVCPYGADANTESSSNFKASKTFSAHVVPTNTKTTPKETAMKSESVEAVASETPVAELTESTPEAATPTADETAAEEQAEASATDAHAVEAETVEATEEAKDATPQDETRAEFSRMRSDFGDVIAAETFASGGTYADAMGLAHARLKSENAALKARISELSAQSTATGRPVKVTEGTKPTAKLFNTGK